MGASRSVPTCDPKTDLRLPHAEDVVTSDLAVTHALAIDRNASPAEQVDDPEARRRLEQAAMVIRHARVEQPDVAIGGAPDQYQLGLYVTPRRAQRTM